jgi:hypothetical protein
MLALYRRARNRIEELVLARKAMGLTEYALIIAWWRGAGGGPGGLSRADRRRSEQYR